MEIWETERRCPKCGQYRVMFIKDNDNRYKFKCKHCSHIFNLYEIDRYKEESHEK